MRESPTKRLIYSTFFALLAGFLVACYNPVDHLKAGLHADTQGLKHGIHLALSDLKRSPTRG